MAVPDLAVAKIRQFCERRVPLHLRDQMHLEVEVRGNSITIADCLWNGAPGKWLRMKIVRARYEAANGRWTLYWAEHNQRWHRYDNLEPTTDLDRVIEEIEQDPSCIFFG